MPSLFTNHKNLIFYNLRTFALSFLLTISVLSAYTQKNNKDEEDLKKEAQSLFEQKKFVDASPLFSQLVSLYPKDANYAYQYGACLIASSSNPEEPLAYLKYAVAQPDVNPEAYFYLGQAYHLNFKFKEAITQYEKFKSNANGKTLKSLNADAMIAMCNSGKSLLSTITELVVYDKKSSTMVDFFRAYDLSEFGGKIIVKPDEFKTDYEKKNNIQSVMYLPDNATRVYFSSYDGKSASGRDIYLADKTEDGWGKPFKLPETVNSNLDDDFPFIHPDGKVLYFASKGHNSMGGYDIFRTFYNETSGKWGEPVNLDFAVNTPFDDFFMITNISQDKAFFASNRYAKSPTVNVYNIAMQRLPIDFELVAGSFSSPNGKKATITVEDTYNNQVIGTYNTNPDGSYNIKLPNSGKFKFLVEEVNSQVTHAGVVDMPKNESFKPLKQKMEIVVENGNEKLIITNLLDEAVKQDLPLPTELIAEQANLKVNYQQKEPQLIAQQNKPKPQGPQLITQTETPNKSNVSSEKDNPISGVEQIASPQKDAQPMANNSSANLENMDISALAKVAESHQIQLTMDANSFQKQADLAKADAVKYQQLVDEENTQMQRLSESPTANSPEIIEEINQLAQDAIQHQQQATAAEELASIYQAKAEQRRDQAKAAKDQKETLNDALTSNQNQEDLEYLNEVKSALEVTQLGYDESVNQPGNQLIYSELLTNYNKQQNVIETNTSYISDLQTTQITNNKRLDELKAELDQNPKKRRKKEIEDEVIVLGNDLISAASEIKNAEQKIADAQNKIQSLNQQLGVAQQYQKQANPTLNTTEQQKQLAAAMQETNFPIKTASQVSQLNQAVPFVQKSESVAISNQPTNIAEQQSNNLASAETSVEVNETNEFAESQSAQDNIQPDIPESSSTILPSESNKMVVENIEKPSDLNNEIYENYNYASDFNREFFLPVPSGAELPLTASTENTLPISTQPKPAEISVLPTEVQFADNYLNLMQGADTIQDDIKRESTKAELLDQWAYKLDTEIFFLKEKRRKATSDDRKAKLTEEITALESQQQQIERAANQSYEYLSVQQNGVIAQAASNNPAMQKQLEYQSLSNVMKTTYNQTYTQKFNQVGEVDDDFVRLFQTKTINESWIEDLNNEIEDLEKIAAVEPDVNKKQIINQRISSLSQLKSRKENELAQNNQNVVQYAFSNAGTQVPKVTSGVTKARAKSLSADAQQQLVNSILLSDSANKITDVAIRNQLITQANAAYEQSQSLAAEAAKIYESLSRFSTSKSQSIAFGSEQEYSNADVDDLVAKQSTSSNNTIENNGAASGKVSLNAMSAQPVSVAAAEALIQQKQTSLNIANAVVENLQAAYSSESDEIKKQKLFEALVLAKNDRTIAEAQVKFASQKAEILTNAENNALQNPSLNEQEIQRVLKEAEMLNTLANDSIAFADKLMADANNLQGEEKTKAILEAEVIKLRAEASLRQANELTKLAEAIKRTEQTALVKNQLPKTVSSFNFPTTNKVLTEAEIKNLTTQPEFTEYSNLKSDYTRVIKEAEIMFVQAENNKLSALANMSRANDLRAQAAKTTDIEERKRLLQEALVVEQEANQQLIESEKMEKAAVELANNAIAKKKELEEFVANLNPAIAALIVAYDKNPEGQGGSFGGVLAENNVVEQPSTPKPTQIKPQQTNVNTLNTTSTVNVNAQNFYAGEDLKNLEVKYDPQTKSVFKIGDANTAYYNEAQPIQFNPELPSGLVYKVQIGAFSKRINPGEFKGFAPITAENVGNNLIRYTAGMFEGFSPADIAKSEIRKIGYSDAFVVAYYNGKRISAADARDMVNLAGAQVASLANFNSVLTNKSNQSANNSTPINTNNLPPTPPQAIQPNQIEANSGNVQVTNLNALSGTFYTVQIGVFKNQVTANDLKNISPIAVFGTDNGFYRYNSGVFDNINDAIAAKNKIVAAGIPDAFVTAYSNKNRVSPQQAQQIMGSNGAQLQNTSTPQNDAPAQPSNPGLAESNNAASVIFRVQVGAYQRDIPVEDAKVILGLTQYGIDIDETEDNLTKYVVGKFKTYSEANTFKNSMVANGLADAFVIALQNGKRIDINQAQKLIGNQ